MDPMIFGNMKAIPGCVLQLCVFISFAHSWPDSVNDMSRFQVSSPGNGSFSDRHVADSIRFLLYDSAPLANDCSRHATAMLQVRIGSIDDRVGFFLGDVTALQDDLCFVCNELHGSIVLYVL